MSDLIYTVVAASSTGTGETVYLTGCDEWSPDLLHAEMIDDDDHAEFRLFVAARQTRLVAGPSLARVRLTADGPVPSAAA